MDPFKILRINRTDDISIVKKAYTRLSGINDPINGGDKAQYDLIKAAAKLIISCLKSNKAIPLLDTKSLQNIKSSNNSEKFDHSKFVRDIRNDTDGYVYNVSHDKIGNRSRQDVERERGQIDFEIENMPRMFGGGFNNERFQKEFSKTHKQQENIEREPTGVIGTSQDFTGIDNNFSLSRGNCPTVTACSNIDVAPSTDNADKIEQLQALVTTLKATIMQQSNLIQQLMTQR